jgi:hypothetical protein
VLIMLRDKAAAMDRALRVDRTGSPEPDLSPAFAVALRGRRDPREVNDVCLSRSGGASSHSPTPYDEQPR